MSATRQNRSTIISARSPADVRAAAQHLRGFQSREPRKLEVKDIPWPHRFVPLGYVESTLYNSDKDDPLTRPTHLRKNDPDGRQGVWKLFEHEHGDDVVIYGGAIPAGAGPWLATAPLKRFPKPATVWWMAELAFLRCQDFDGHEFEIRPSRSTNLWGTADAKAFLLLPKDTRGLTPADVFVVRGGRMRIEPMGIEY